MKLLWLINVLLLVGSGHRVVGNDISVKYVHTWETVILPCQLQPSVIAMRWRRENDYYIFKGLQANSNFTANNRYAIVGNHLDGEYNLQITNISEKDNGTYVCDLQLKNNITYTKYLLSVKESENVAAQTSSWTKVVTDRNSLKQITCTATNTNEEESSTLSEKRKSTESNKEDFGKAGEKETGISFREMFYYGLLAAGLVLVLFLSTLCNACVNRKCGMAIPKTTETITNDNKTDTTEDNNENMEITERNDITSLYETINENEMLPDSSVAEKCSLPSHHSTSIALPERPYFEIDDSYLDVIPANSIDQSRKPLHTKIETSMTADISLHRVKRRSSLPESKSSSEETVDVTQNRDDGYLHPYVALKTDEMEYLHSYSTPCLVPVEISTLSVPESVKDYYTDGLSAKQVITQV